MTALMFDGASPFDLAAAKAAGGVAASVYIVGTPGGMPHADAARVTAIRAAGLGAVANWERAADFFSTCTVSGALAAGVEALAACESLGFPADGSAACYFSFDFDCSGRYAEMLNKFRAVQAGLTSAYQARAYGQQGLVDYLAGNGFPGKHWLMMSTFGLPYPIGPNVAVVQAHDPAGNWLNSPVAGTDVNTVLDPNSLGAWWPDGSPYGDDMTPEEHAALMELRNIARTGRSDGDSKQWPYPFTPDAALQSKVDALTAQVTAILKQLASPDAVAAAVLAKLPPAATGGLTRDDVSAAVRDVLSATTLTPA